MVTANHNYINSIGTDLYYIQDNIRKINTILNSLGDIYDAEVIHYHLKNLSAMTGEMNIKARDMLNTMQIVENINLMNKLAEENKKITERQKRTEQNKKKQKEV